MTTAAELELTTRLQKSGFTVNSYTAGDEAVVEPEQNVHIDLSKKENVSLAGHIELDAEGSIVEAFIQLLDENGQPYTKSDTIVFVEDADCEDHDKLIKRLEHVFA